MSRAAAALSIAAGACVQAQTIPDLRAGVADRTATPEATIEERIDPWNRWSLKLYVEPAPGGEARGGMEARFVTRRFTSHDLQAGAAVAVSPLQPPGPAEPWQSIDERGSALFVEDRLRWTSSVSMSAGARLIGSHGDVGLQQRLALAWQPGGSWALNLTDGAVQPLSTASSGAGTIGAKRFRGLELQTEHAAGSLTMRARAASQMVIGLDQTQFVHAAAVSLAMPFDGRWSIGSDTLLSTQGDQTRLRLSSNWPRERATMSLLVPYRFGGRPIDPALAGSLPFVEPDDGTGWRAQVELTF